MGFCLASNQAEDLPEVIIVRSARNLGIARNSGTCPYRVCSTCGAAGHSARECPTKIVSILNSCGDESHEQNDRPSDEVCERCQEHGHNEAECPKPRCKACGSLNHRNARSFDCSEHKCSKGAMGPKEHDKNNCPEILNAICTLCGQIGHNEEPYPTRPCPACGCRTHRLPTHFECPEHVCTACDQEGHNRTNCPNNQCDTCGLFGHYPMIAFVHSVDVDIDWLIILMSTKTVH